MKIRPTFAVFLACFVYWGYLIFASQMSIKFDAADYEFIGSIIHEKGWLEFFRTGPHREPLYPWVIAVSMTIADNLSVSYHIVQKVIQVLILFVTQLLAFGLLRRLKIRESLQLAMLLYIGFSPAIVNSAFSLFAEIITYPFVLAILWLGVLSWRAIYRESYGRIVLLAISTALAFVLTTFVKGVFEYIFWAYLVFLGLMFINVRGRIFANSIIYFLLVLWIFNISIVPFKLLNQKYNGQYVLTNRFADLLFGNAVKRTNPLSMRMLSAHAASIPGAGACRLFFTEEECSYCEFQKADYYRSTLLGEVKQATPPEKITSETISLAANRISERPGQYVFLMFMESLRMPFWESTQLGNVVYPTWLQKFYDFAFFKNLIRLLMSALTYISFVYLLSYLIRNRGRLTDFKSADSERIQICFFILFLVFVYTALHSLFSIVTRYALPISFLYLLGIAFFFEQRFIHKEEKPC